MMNETVARIVDLMFENMEMNEEVAAIRDEVMNNCQERYNDLVSSGIGENEAITAVLESLKGMEEILAPYKRKASRRVNVEVLDELEEELEDLEEELEDLEDLEDEESGETNVTLAAHLVQKIDLALVSEDVSVEASDDESYHVMYDREENPRVQVALENDGVLRIDRGIDEEKIRHQAANAKKEFKGETEELFRTEKGKLEINMNSIGNMLSSVADSLKAAFKLNHVNIQVGLPNSGVTIQVPPNAMPHVKLLTTSGDIRAEDVSLADLDITTTSGDVEVDLSEEELLKRLELRTTSGDIEVTAFTDYASIATTSGDVEVNGRHSRLSIGTISGDIEVNAEVEKMNFSAVSGDVDLAFDSTDIQSVNGSTVSGDIEIELPDGIGIMAIQTQTRSGDVTNRCRTNGVGPTVTGGVSSMSGDITIR